MRSQITLCAILLALASCSEPETEPQPQGSDGLTIIEDEVYGHKLGLAMTFNVFRPAESNGAGVILINSGGWRSPFEDFVTDDGEERRLMTRAELDELDARWGEFSPHPLLDRGYTVFEVRHGSSPRFVVPEIVADLRRAVRYIRLHAAEYGVDSARLGAWGGSAGGHLSLILGTTSEIRNEGGEGSVEAGSGQLAAVVSYFPVSDILRFVTDAPERLAQFPALQFDQESYAAYSPLHFASADDPPTLIIHGDEDALVPIVQGESMYEALSAAGVTTQFIVIPGAGHGFLAEDADRAAAETVAWFEQHLSGR